MKKLSLALRSGAQALGKKSKGRLQSYVKKKASATEAAIVERTALNSKQVEFVKQSVTQHWEDGEKQYKLKLLVGQMGQLKAINLNDVRVLMDTPAEYWRGLLLYQMKDWAGAEKLFRKAVEKNPNHARSNFKLGMSLFKQKKWDVAYASMLTASQLDSSMERWKVQLIQSRRRMLTGFDFSGSSTSIQEALLREKIELNIDVFDSCVALSKNLKRQGKYWQQIEILQQAIQMNKKSADLYIDLGEACLEMKRYQEAQAAFVQAVSLNKEDKNPYLYYKCGYSLEKSQAEESQIEKYYKLAISQDEELDSNIYGIGAFHEKFGLWYDAVSAYKKLLNKQARNSSLAARLAFAYLRCYDFENAFFYYKNAISDSLVTDPEHLYRLGFISERLQHFDVAAEYYQAALGRKYTAYWYYRLGTVFSAMGKHKEAVQAFLATKRNFNLKRQFIKDLELVRRERLFDDKKLCPYAENAHDFNELLSFYYQLIYRQCDYQDSAYYALGYILAELGEYEQADEILKNIRLLRNTYGLSVSKFDNNENFRQSALYIEYFKQLPIKKKVILFESFGGSAMTCSPLAIFLAMLKRPEFNDFTYIWVIDEQKNAMDEFKDRENIFFVKKNSDLYLRFLCSAEYLVNNATFPAYFIRKEGQYYLNTWHGTPWKTLGKDIKNSFMELKNTQRNFLQSSHLISPNPHTSWVLTERYDICDIYTGKFLECGYPRIDLTLNTSEKRKWQLYDLLNLDVSKPIVLYAPTWRGTLGSPEVESSKLISEIQMISKLDVNVLFRGHYFVENSAYDLGIGKYIVPSTINTNELLSIVDVLITDYSSISFDYMVTNRPIIYYIDDYEHYEDSRGLYFKPEEMPGVLAFSKDELLRSLKDVINDRIDFSKEYEKSHQFILHEDGNVSDRVVDWFVCGRDDADEVSLQSQSKKSLLLYGGEFIPNGITTSLINLLENIDKTKYTVSLLIDPNAVASDEKRLQQFYRLPQDIKIIPRVGRMNRTIENDWIEAKANQYKFLPERMREYFESDYAYEFKRILGGAHFDAAIEFTGYSRFWAYVLGFANDTQMLKTIYQHNDLYGEWKMRFPRLENTFSVYYKFDKIISVSKQTMELNIENLAELFSIERDKFDYCDNVQNPNDVLKKAIMPLNDTDEMYFQTSGKVFVNLARLSPEKNQAKLIKAFRKVVDVYPDARLLILGDGPLKNDLSKLILDSNLSENVFLLGIRFNPFPILERADCFVLSSDHEGQPMTLFEAMILKKPIISTDITGSRSAIEGRSGLLVENNEEGLFFGMRDFIEENIVFNDFDYDEYQQNALNMFYSKVCSK